MENIMAVMEWVEGSKWCEWVSGQPRHISQTDLSDAPCKGQTHSISLKLFDKSFHNHFDRIHWVQRQSKHAIKKLFPPNHF